MPTSAKLHETHDRMWIVIKFDDATDMRINVSRYKMSITSSKRLYNDQDVVDRACKFIMNYITFKVGNTQNTTGDRMRAIKCYAETTDKKTFLEQAQGIAVAGENLAGNTKKQADKDAEKVRKDLAEAKASGKPGAVLKVLADNVAKPRTTHPVNHEAVKATVARLAKEAIEGNKRLAKAAEGSKYDYPAGLTEAQKKAFRAKARAAAKKGA